MRKREKVEVPKYRNQRDFLESISSDDEDGKMTDRRQIKGPNGTIVLQRKEPRYVNMEAEDIRASFHSALGVSSWPGAEELGETVLDKEEERIRAEGSGKKPRILQDFMQIRSSNMGQASLHNNEMEKQLRKETARERISNIRSLHSTLIDVKVNN